MRTRGGTFCIISSRWGRSSFEGSGLWSLHEVLELGARGFFFPRTSTRQALAEEAES